jgi:adenosylcobinamide-GDP ribazoletransferase
MADFLIALQFLTRIHLVRQVNIAPETFGACVRWFPLVGALIGAILAGVLYFADPYLPIHTLAAALIILEFFLTGGLHCDGLMDSADGLLSGRPRERMLEIMKDSRVGAHGVTAFVLLALAKWSLLLDLLPAGPAAARFAMPVLGRLAMVIAISIPYARPKASAKPSPPCRPSGALYRRRHRPYPRRPLGPTALLALAAAVIFAWPLPHVSRCLAASPATSTAPLPNLAK